ncbi:MAG: hypothetical protein KDA78_12330, partial [Planctomycetaceae bacterium]|nr:hypothetical protein [Planctomycetaceae bacterium]
MRFSLPGNHPPLNLRALAGSHSRRGILLPIVMVVIVLAALSCYQFADRMTTERQVVSYLKQESQAHQAALSGIDYAIALLTDPELDPQDFLSLTPEEYAWQVILPGNEAAEVPNDLMVTLVSRDLTYQQGSVMFGVGLESGKINLNALAELDVPLEDQ